MSDKNIADILVRAGLADDYFAIVPLSGGVSCETWRATSASRDYVVKVALPQLRVAAEWHAPVERAQTEARWFAEAARIVPDAVPRLIAALPADHALVTEFLPPGQAPIWKQELTTGHVTPAFAGAVGRILADLFLATAGRVEIERDFADHGAFHALRIEPFLLFTASRHPEVAPILGRLAADLATRREALIHGDVSPKNILMAFSGPVLLDAECAVYGDPAFDLAFCITHLLLKAAWLPAQRGPLIASAMALFAGFTGRAGEQRAIEQRVTMLVPALLLARIDGRSPADYIDTESLKTAIGTRAKSLLRVPANDLASLFTSWSESMP